MEVKLPPTEIVIRPPVEAYSVLIPVTGGCSWNRCRFCGVYKGVQDYAIIPLDTVKRIVDAYAGRYPRTRRVFLAGGNPTSAPTEYLVEVVRHVRGRFPNLERLSMYAKALDVLRKTPSELRELAGAGLTIVYMGLESGSSEVLRRMKKGTNAIGNVKAGKKVLDAGIDLSLYVILGLGSYELSEEHCRETARVLTEINPTVFRFRTLNVMRNSPLWEDYQRGSFKLIRPVDMLREEYSIIEQLGPNVDSQVFNDHVSNYCDVETDDIRRDREKFLLVLKRAIEDPRVQALEPRNLEFM
ncbi:MAG: radical SAM protein [Promethearchaeota archaeon]